MSQYTHDYEASPFCNNFDGAINKANCSHSRTFPERHCAHCGKEKSNSVHQTEEVKHAQQN